MREIKFRAWDKKNKKMIEVWQIDWNDEGEIEYINRCNDLSNFVPLQYIGLKDKNGREIYEGDIIYQRREWNRITVRGEVVFRRGMFVLRREAQDYLLNETAEVIGNIYENPELLRKGGE